MGQAVYLVIGAATIFVFSLVRAQGSDTENIFNEAKSDKEFLDHLLESSRYDKRLLPPVTDADFCCGMTSPASPRLPEGNPHRISVGGKIRGQFPPKTIEPSVQES